MTEPLKFAMVFTADASAVKAATQDVRTEVEAVGSEATDTSAALDKNSAALEKNAAAAKKAADAARDQAKAEADARKAVNQSTGVTPSAPVAIPASAPQSGTPTGPASGGPTAKQLEDLRARYVPLYAAQREYEAELGRIKAAEKDGALTTEQSALALARLKQSYDNQVVSITRSNAALGGAKEAIALTSNEYKLLAHNVSDTVQGFALGIPIEQVLLQQGPALAENVGGIGNAFKILGGFLTVSNIALAATAGAVVLAGAAYASYVSSIKEVQTSAAGLGRAVAGTAADMETAAEAGASAANITVKAARSMEAQFLSTGKIGSENFQKLIAISRNFAASTGTDADTAGQALSQMFSDPAAAAQTLFRQFGLIDSRTAEYATNLAQQNRLSEAQAVLLDALPKRLVDATTQTTAFGHAWEFVSTSASNAYDAIGRAIDKVVSAGSLQEQMATAQRQLQTALITQSDSGTAAAQAKVDAIQKQLDAQKKAQEDAQRSASVGFGLGISDQSPATATMRQIEATKNAIAGIQKGLAAASQDPDAVSAEQTEELNKALAAKQALLAGLEHQQQRLAAVDQLDISIQNQKDPLLKAQLTEQREKIALSLQEGDVTAANLQAQRAGNDVINGAIASAAAQASDMRTEIEIRTKLNAQVAAGTLTSSDADAQLQKELALRPLVLAAATAEAQGKTELYKQLTQTIKDLSAGYDGLAASQKQAAANDFIKGQNDNIATLKAQRSVLGESEATQARVLAQLTAEQKIRDMGLATSSQQAQEIRTNASAIADMNSALDKAKDAWSTYKQAGSDAIDTIFDGINNGDKASDIGKSIEKSVLKAAEDLIVINPLKNLFLGTNLGTIDDLFKGKSSGILSSLAGQTTGTMNVTAATVMVNGGVTGGIGSLLGGNSGTGSASGSTIGGIVSGVSDGVTKTGINLATITTATGKIAQVNSQYASNFQGLVNDLQSEGYKVDSIGGYNYRNIAGTNTLSNHAFGDAIDINPAQNPMGKSLITDIPNASQLAAKNGLSWGGDWTSKKDAMHFEVANDDAANSVSKMGSAASTTSSSVGSLGNATGTAANGLTTLGGGLSKFGQALSSAQSSGNGGLVSLLGSLTGYGQSVFNSSAQFSSAISAGGLGLYDEGGYTGPGAKMQAAGIVHAGEVVFSQADVARFGGPAAVESIRLGKRGWAEGGVVESYPMARSAANSNSAPSASASGGGPGGTFHIHLDGARGDKDVMNMSYVGMQKALDEYHKNFPEYWHEVNTNPRARTA